MRLTDLDPRWLMFDGRRVGLVFRSPTKREWWQTCFVEQFNLFSSGAPDYDPDNGTTPDSQCRIVWAAVGEETANWQGCKKGCAWTVAGGIAVADFESISVKPSLDGSAGGLWHGHITNGAIEGGI